MPRDRDDGPDDTGAEAAPKHIKDVLNTRKAKADESSINDAVHMFVEVLVPPDEEEQDEELAQLLGKTGLDEGRVEDTVRIYDCIGDADHKKGQRDGEHTSEKGQDKHPRGLFLIFVLPIDKNHQQNDR